MGTYEEILETFKEKIKTVSVVEIADIPKIDLYMDQVTTFMDQALAPYKRSSDGKVLTKTMINNYAKNHLLPPPVKKKYSKEHLFILTFIYYFKNILSINDIQVLLTPLTEKYFPGGENLQLKDIYEEVMKLELEQIQPLAKDVTKKFNESQESFSDASEEECDFLQKFAFICMLSFDVYVKKQVIEHLIDQMSDPES